MAAMMGETEHCCNGGQSNLRIVVVKFYAINEADYPLAGLPYLPHLRHAADHATPRDDASAAALLNNFGYLLYAQGNLGGRGPCWNAPSLSMSRALGPAHPAAANSLNNLAALLAMQGELEAARSLYTRAVAIVTQALGPDHPTTRRFRAHLDALLRQLGG